MALSHVALALERFEAGEWSDAEAEAEAALELGDEAGTRVWSVLLHSVLATIAIHRDELAAANRATASAEELLERTGLAHLGLERLMRARALLFESAGQEVKAVEILEGAWYLGESLGLSRWRWEIGPDLVRLATATGREELARRTFQSFEDGKGPFGPVARRTALLCRGLATDDPDAMVQAVSDFRRSPRPLGLAAAAESAAGSLGRNGRPQEARLLFDEAIEIYQRLGANRDVARTDGAMRSFGIRRSRGPRRRPVTGWDSLTGAELAVVRLAAEGLTNPEIGARLFISKRTVGAHLSHVFAKLGLGSRVELAREFAARWPSDWLPGQ